MRNLLSPVLGTKMQNLLIKQQNNLPESFKIFRKPNLAIFTSAFLNCFLLRKLFPSPFKSTGFAYVGRAGCSPWLKPHPTKTTSKHLEVGPGPQVIPICFQVYNWDRRWESKSALKGPKKNRGIGDTEATVSSHEV